MKLVYNMVHDNPGEPHFSTSFNNPEKLKAYGFNGQVDKHIHTAVSYHSLSKDIFIYGSKESEWLEAQQQKWKKLITAAKGEGLSIASHIDLFVMPRKLVERYQDELCYEGTLRIDYTKEKVYEIQRIMFQELFELFPDLDGFFVRLGETYLYDFPYHIGNGPSNKKDEYGGNIIPKDAYVKIIKFLREDVCEKYNKHVFIRTWDCFNDGFHANPKYYLDVTNQIEPHDRLFFSIKHTALDFWRRVRVNECLGIGKHQQIIEVQAQREYEGKGAYPCYVMDGVIDCFPENKVKKGLKDFMNHPLFRGVFIWARGGGWYGPYIDEKREFWADLNTYVISQYVSGDNILSELEIFNRYLEEKLGIIDDEQKKFFREICQLSQEAILKGRYCEVYDSTLEEITLPVNLWMRDDRLGGKTRLKPVFEVIYQKDKVKEVLREKQEAIELWEQVKQLYEKIDIRDSYLKAFIGISIEYGFRLFSLVEAGWQVLINGFIGDKTGKYDIKIIKKWIKIFDERYKRYLQLGENDICPSLYQLNYFALPDEEEPSYGMGESIDYYRNMIK